MTTFSIVDLVKDKSESSIIQSRYQKEELFIQGLF